MRVAPGFRRIGTVLGQRNYGTYTAGSAVSLIGSWMQRIAVGWLTWELTESGTWLGLIAFAHFFPTVVIGPLAGAAADRWHRLSVIRICQAFGLLQSLTLFILMVTGVMTAPLLLVLTLWLGIAVAVNQPARMALVPSLVSREHVATAVAVNSIIFNSARFVGPAIAGIVIVMGGIAVAFAINALTFAAFLFALSRLKIEGERRAGRSGNGLFEDVREGIGYAIGHQGIAVLLVLLIANSLLVRPVVDLLPGFTAMVFGGGPGVLALLTSTIGVGAIVGGLWLAQRQSDRGLTAIVLMSGLALAIAVLVFISTDRLSVAVPVVAVMGFLLVSIGVGTQTLLQLRVAPEMRGRVLSLFGLILHGGTAIGALAVGALSETIGLDTAFALGALVTLATACWAGTRFRRLRRVLEPGMTPM